MTLKVLLQGVVDDFEECVLSHNRGHWYQCEEIGFDQPFVELSFHMFCLRSAGYYDHDFHDICSISGASSLFAYDRKAFGCKYAHLSIDFEKKIEDATGFPFIKKEFKDEEECFKIVKESVDEGIPLKGKHFECLMFAGYEEEKRKSEDNTEPQRKVFCISDGPETYGKWWSWDEFKKWVDMMKMWNCMNLRMFSGEDKRPKLKNKEIVENVVEMIIAHSQGRTVPESLRNKYPDAKWGLEGMEEFANDMKSGNPPKDEGGPFKFCHALNPQILIRCCTWKFLERSAENFDSEQKIILKSSSEMFQKAYLIWFELWKESKEKKVDQWDENHREESSKKVFEAIGLEKKGVEILKGFIVKE